MNYPRWPLVVGVLTQTAMIMALASRGLSIVALGRSAVNVVSWRVGTIEGFAHVDSLDVFEVYSVVALVLSVVLLSLAAGMAIAQSFLKSTHKSQTRSTTDKPHGADASVNPAAPGLSRHYRRS
jgi:hypothetical protein